MDMTPERWAATQEYIHDVFGAEDQELRSASDRARAEGLPPIAVNAELGRLLMILTATTPGRLAVELGTLGGYSGTWIARGLAPDGRLVTVEAEPHHAAVAEEQFARAGLADRVEVRRGRALEVLAELAGEVPPGSVDVAFVDADKTEYPQYALGLRPLIASGGLFLADNVLGTGSAWIDNTSNPGMAAVDEMNRMVAAWDDFESVIVPLRQGLLISRRT